MLLLLVIAVSAGFFVFGVCIGFVVGYDRGAEWANRMDERSE